MRSPKKPDQAVSRGRRLPPLRPVSKLQLPSLDFLSPHLCCLVLSAVLASPALAQVNYTEPPDLSGSLNTPTPVGTLAAGVNTVGGTISASWTAAGFPVGDAADSFSFTVPAGLAVTSVELDVTNYVCRTCASRSRSLSSGLSFVGINANGTFTMPITAPGGFLAAGTYNAQASTGPLVPNAVGNGSFAYQYRIRAIPANNDSCEFATPVGLGATAFDNTSATTDGPDLPPNPCGGLGNLSLGADLWYTFTAPIDGLLRVDTCGSDFDTVLVLYSGGPCGSLAGSILACNDDGGCELSSLQSVLGHEVAAGQTYLVRVAGYFGGTGTGTLNLTLNTTGACCSPVTGGCLLLRAADCATFGGEFVGFAQGCAPGACTVCPADFNRSGGLSVQDIFDFLAAYFAGCP